MSCNPPVTPLIGLTTEPLAVEAILAAVQAGRPGNAGAVLPFIGVVRDNSLGHSVHCLEYEAYAPMALAEMHKIATEVGRRWQLPCAIWHRLGTLHVGEASVVVAVAAPHRGEAFEAARYAIDAVKSAVPIWKKEIANDGTWWVDDPAQATAALLPAARL